MPSREVHGAPDPDALLAARPQPSDPPVEYEVGEIACTLTLDHRMAVLLSDLCLEANDAYAAADLLDGDDAKALREVRRRLIASLGEDTLS